MNTARLSALAALFLLAAGCSHPVPRVTVDILDTSLSITPRAERAAETALLDQISRMGRGDRLILIPITGDAQNDTGGRILRLAAPTEREAYDNDLRRFQADAKKQYCAWVASLDQHQTRTDILGALDVARQELAALPMDADRRLIVLSDFLEDDFSYRFVHAPQLTSIANARALATTLRADRRFALPGVSVCLGRLESSEFAPLSQRRKDAVQAFWTAYLTDDKRVAELHFDGVGLLAGSSSCSEQSKPSTNN